MGFFLPLLGDSGGRAGVFASSSEDFTVARVFERQSPWATRQSAPAAGGFIFRNAEGEDALGRGCVWKDCEGVWGRVELSNFGGDGGGFARRLELFGGRARVIRTRTLL